MNRISNISSTEKNIDIDVVLLLKRMMSVATIGDMNLADVLSYELCNNLIAIFEKKKPITFSYLMKF